MKKSILLFMLFCSIFLLAACGKTAEEQIDLGISKFEEVFKREPKEPNKKISDIELYLPSRYSIDFTEDTNNYIIEKGSDVYILFLNKNEENNSKLQYDILKNDTSKNIIKEKTLEVDDTFSFVAVVKEKEQYELIVCSGGIKISTVSNGKNIDDKLLNMMEIIHSVQYIGK